MKREVQIKNKGITHVNATCAYCGKIFDNHHTAKKQAYDHVKNTGHRVHGETGTTWEYYATPFTKET